MDRGTDVFAKYLDFYEIGLGGRGVDGSMKDVAAEIQRMKVKVEEAKLAIAKEKADIAENELAHVNEVSKIREEIEAAVARREEHEAETLKYKEAIRNMTNGN